MRKVRRLLTRELEPKQNWLWSGNRLVKHKICWKGMSTDDDAFDKFEEYNAYVGWLKRKKRRKKVNSYCKNCKGRTEKIFYTKDITIIQKGLLSSLKHIFLGKPIIRRLEQRYVMCSRCGKARKY